MLSGECKTKHNQKKKTQPTIQTENTLVTVPTSRKVSTGLGRNAKKYLIKALELDSFPRRLFLHTPAGDGGAVSLSQHCSRQVGEGRWGRVVALLLSTQAFGDPAPPHRLFCPHWTLHPMPAACGAQPQRLLLRPAFNHSSCVQPHQPPLACHPFPRLPVI